MLDTNLWTMLVVGTLLVLNGMFGGGFARGDAPVVRNAEPWEPAGDPEVDGEGEHRSGPAHGAKTAGLAAAAAGTGAPLDVPSADGPRTQAA
jgi:hypothetical protein